MKTDEKTLEGNGWKSIGRKEMTYPSRQETRIFRKEVKAFSSLDSDPVYFPLTIDVYEDGSYVCSNNPFRIADPYFILGIAVELIKADTSDKTHNREKVIDYVKETFKKNK